MSGSGYSEGPERLLLSNGSDFEPWMVTFNCALQGHQWAIKWCAEHPDWPGMIIRSFKAWVMKTLEDDIDELTAQIGRLVRIRMTLLAEWSNP